MMRAIWLAGAALLMASGARAGEIDELHCVESSYTPEQIEELNRLLPNIDILSESENSSMDALGMLVGTSAIECAATFDWTDSEFETVLFFEMGRVMETAVRQHGPLSRTDVALIDAALARSDRSALWSAIEEQVVIGVAGEENVVSDENAAAFDEFLLEIGFGMGLATSEQVGAFLAALAMQRMSARNFAEM